jgi:iron(III) transport system permease protein
VAPRDGRALGFYTGAMTRRWLEPTRFATLWATLAVLAAVPMLVSEDRAWGLLANTARFAVGTCAIGLPAGVVLAMLLVRTNLPGRRAIAALLAGVLLVPLYVQCGAWQAAFGLQGWWRTATGAAAPWISDGWGAAVWVQSMAAIPWVALIVGGGLYFVPRELEEEALLDGSPAQVFRRVTLPYTLSLVCVAALLVAVSAAGDMTVTDQFQVRTYAEEVYTATSGGEPSAPLRTLPGVTLALWLFAAALLVVLRLTPWTPLSNIRPPLVFQLGRWRWPLAVLAMAAIAVLVGVPIGSLAWKAGVLVSHWPSGYVRTWSLEKCLSITARSPARYSRELFWSFAPGVLAATSAVAAALPAAWLARRGGWRQAPLATSAAIALAVPGPLLGLATIWLLNRNQTAWLYDHTVAGPWLVQWVRVWPLVALVVACALRSIPREETQSAALEGAGPLATLARIGLAQRLPAVAAAWLAALALAIGELAATHLVTPPGMQSLAFRIFDLLHAGVEDQVASICLALFLLLPLLGLTTAWLTRRWLLGMRKA